MLRQEVSKWWPGLITFQKWRLLHLFQCLILACSYLLIHDEFGVMIFTEVVHLVEYLDDMPRVGFVWFGKIEIERLKVGTRL